MTIGPTFITLEQARQPGPFNRPLVNVQPIAQGQWRGWYHGTDIHPTIYDARVWEPVRNAYGAIVNLRQRRMRGVGDAVARMTSAVGIKPCAPCQQRQRKLNRWFPFS